MNPKTKILLLEGAKWLLVAALAVFLWLLLGANRVSRADFSTVSQAVCDAADLTPMAQGDSQMLMRLYGLSAGDYEDMTLYCPTTNMGAEELLVLRLKDPSQGDAVQSALEHRVETQKHSFEGYGVDQFAMLEQAVITVQGNYVLFVVARDPDPVRRAFLDAL